MQTPTNVTRIARAVANTDTQNHAQIVYYQAGVGTGNGVINHLLGGGTGLGISENIREAYAFLASNYTANDSVFLIGFSRGAFTVRSIGGIIGQLGLLKKECMQYFRYVFHDWETAGDPKNDTTKEPSFIDEYPEIRKHPKYKKLVKPANQFNGIDEWLAEYKKLLYDLELTHPVPVKIKAIGVWDTVGALGIPVNPRLVKIFKTKWIKEYSWFDTTIGNHVDYAFHALALDEKRAPYQPAIWERPEGCKTHLKQVWFPGAHSNVGGSYEDTASADITLAWMMDQLSGDALHVDKPDLWRPVDWIQFDEQYVLDQYSRYKRPHRDWKASNIWAMGRLIDSFNGIQMLASHRDRAPGRYRKMNYETGIEYGPDYEPNKYPHNMLRDTNELVHASVRLRIDLEGRSPEAEPGQHEPWYTKLYKKLRKLAFLGPYEPRALDGWSLQDGHEHKQKQMRDSTSVDGWNVADIQSRIGQGVQGKAPVWVWKGKLDYADVPRDWSPKSMEEDRLGKFELELLRAFDTEDRKIAEWVERTNRGLTPLEGGLRVIESVKRKSVTMPI